MELMYDMDVFDRAMEILTAKEPDNEALTEKARQELITYLALREATRIAEAEAGRNPVTEVKA